MGIHMTDNIYKLKRKLFYKELEPLFKDLSSVRYAVIKGEVLSQQIYGVPDRRKSYDIDILIDKNNVKFLEDLLLKLGFEQKLPDGSTEDRRNRVLCMAFSHQIPSYHKEKFGFQFNVDVNYDIFWGEYVGERIDIDDFLSDIIEIDIYGMQVYTLTPIKTMIQLILHHYKEMNSIYHLAGSNCINYNMFKDVYYLLKNNLEIITLDNLYQISSAYKIIPFVFYVLYYTNQIHSDSELESYVTTFKTQEGGRLLDYYGLTEKERKLWKVDFKSRLETVDLFSLIKNDLSESDIEKLNRNRRIFG